MMRKNISVGVMIMAVMCAVVSCNMKDDTYTVSYSDNAAITAFTLGTVKDTLTVLDEDGNVIKKKYQPTVDSTTVTTYSSGTFAVRIDQLSTGTFEGQEYDGEIYNTDSLPYNSYMKMLATVSSLDYGTVIYQDWNEDPDGTNWTSYSSTDSINFSKPLRFRVVSTDATNAKDYKVSICAHKERSGIYDWFAPVTVPAFQGATSLKGVATTDSLYVLCDNGLYSSKDGSRWDGPKKNSDGDVIVKGQSIVVQGNNIYVLDKTSSPQTLYCYNNATYGVSKHNVSSLTYLAAAGTKRLYAVSTNTSFVESADGGVTWEASLLANGEDLSYVPAKDICYTVSNSKTNEQIEEITVIGNMDSGVNQGDTCAVIWNKTVTKKTGETVDDWAKTESSTDNFRLPRLSDLSSCAYNKTWLLAIGGDPEVRGIKSTAYDRIYVSRNSDNGITWEKATGLRLPIEASSDRNRSLLMSDYKGQYFYFITPSDGKVYRGKLNDATWTNK